MVPWGKQSCGAPPWLHSPGIRDLVANQVREIETWHYLEVSRSVALPEVDAASASWWSDPSEGNRRLGDFGALHENMRTILHRLSQTIINNLW